MSQSKENRQINGQLCSLTTGSFKSEAIDVEIGQFITPNSKMNDRAPSICFTICSDELSSLFFDHRNFLNFVN